jgi:hypothetical protein
MKNLAKDEMSKFQRGLLYFSTISGNQNCAVLKHGVIGGKLIHRNNEQCLGGCKMKTIRMIMTQPHLFLLCLNTFLKL